MKQALPVFLTLGAIFSAVALDLDEDEDGIKHHHRHIQHAVALKAAPPPPGVKVPPTKYGPFDPRDQGHGKRNVFAIVFLAMFGLLLSWYKGEFLAETKGADGMRRTQKTVETDTYGFALVSLVRDMQQIAGGNTSVAGLRTTRIGFAMGLLFFTTFLQVFIMYYLKTLVIAKWVTDIRDDYSAYQEHMYGPGGTFLNINGKHRGIDGHFQPGNFDSLDESLKERTCNIAFSQPTFFAAVLLIWTLTVIGEIRNVLALFRSLIINTRNIGSMADSLVDLDPDIDDNDPDNAWVIDGLTLGVKFLITVSVLIPRMIVTCILLWLGCRFLAATNDFGGMVLNAVALEFILCLKDVLYSTIVPDRNKREIEHINIRPSTMVDYPTYWAYLGTFSWLAVAMAWIVFYVFHFQMVLPLYKWDVRGPCTQFIKIRYNDAPTTPPPAAR